MNNRDSIKSELFSIVSLRIRDARIKNGMSQDNLAEKLNISRTSVINIEKGRHNPNFFMVYEIAFHLNIDVNDLIPDMELFKEIINNSKEDNFRIVDLKQLHGINTINEENVFNTVGQFLKTLSKNDENDNKG